jgi:hypothetical protein
MHSRNLAASQMVVMLCGQSIMEHFEFNTWLIICDCRAKWTRKESARKKMYVGHNLFCIPE